jgi:ABC-2 type transport system permease protein/lipopolysaccharide transport system permease protein
LSADLPQPRPAIDGLAGVAGSPRRSERIAAAAADLRDGLDRRWLWMALAHQDMRLRYRGSLLGPFWQTVTTVVMIGSMGLIYAKLFQTTLQNYLPMLTVGLIVWQFISGMIIEGCSTFFSAQGIIQQVKLPLSLHVYRLVYRNLLVLAHNFVIVPIVLLMFPRPLAWPRLAELLPGMALLILNGVSVSFLFGMISARFRDVPPIVASIVQVAFFVTPIFWSAEALGANRWWAELNPLFAAIDVLRAPLLGRPTAPHSWLILVLISALLGGVSFAFFARFRARIAFWV